MVLGFAGEVMEREVREELKSDVRAAKLARESREALTRWKALRTVARMEFRVFSSSDEVDEKEKRLAAWDNGETDDMRSGGGSREWSTTCVIVAVS